MNEAPLAELRQAVDTVGQQPVEERIAVFEWVNRQLAAELAALDEL